MSLLLTAVVVVALGAVAAAVLLLGEEDQTGPDSPTAAVEQLLAASVDGDLARAREVTSGLSDEELQANLAEIAAFVESSGGLDKVSAHDDASRQMGSGHVVEVLVSDSARTVTFDVYQNSGRYRVAVGDLEDPDDLPTSEPDPPPSQAAQLCPAVRLASDG